MKLENYIELSDKLIDISNDEHATAQRKRELENQFLELAQLKEGDRVRLKIKYNTLLNTKDCLFRVLDVKIKYDYGYPRIAYTTSTNHIYEGLTKCIAIQDNILYDDYLYTISEYFEVINDKEEVIRTADKTKFQNMTQFIKNLVVNKYKQ